MAKKVEFSEAALKACFDEMDEDKSGFVCKKEMLRVYKKMGCSDEEAEFMAQDLKEICDKDGDEKISWEEFKKYFPLSL